LKKCIFATITVATSILVVVSIFSGCSNKEEPPMPETRQLVIPPEYEPEDVLAGFGGDIWFECVYEVGSNTDKCPDVKFFAELHELENGFLKGYFRKYSTYMLKDGRELGIAYPLLTILVLKYQTPGAAVESFNLYTERIDLKNIIIEGVKVKWKHNPKEPMVYMLQSNSFIMRIDGSVQPCEDALSRIIERYSVPISKDY
jgi:hypothetical protein